MHVGQRRTVNRDFGYNDHISIDNKHKLIRDYAVTLAEVHDSQVFFDVLADNSAKDVWADSAYQSVDNEMTMDAMDYCSHVHEKGQRNKPLSKRQQQANHKRSKIRVRVEHVFGSITNEQSGLFYRVIGLERIAAKIGLTNLVYNMRRLVVLNRMSVPAI